jgi:hypothetical protein
MRRSSMAQDFLKDDDLADLFAELEDVPQTQVEEEDPEMQAAQRRYMEIIKKHKDK